MPAPIAATVLIVDDDPVIAMMCGLGLERAGYRVLSAKNGVTGLELVATAHPDLILLDVRMPVMDGIEVLTSFRRMWRRRTSRS